MKYFLGLIIVLYIISCSDGQKRKIIIKDKLIQYVPLDKKTKYFDNNSRLGNNSIIETWASHVLYDLGEPVLSPDPKKGEFIRFIWLRAFENPVVVRLDKLNDTSYLIIKELKYTDDNALGPKIILDTLINLDNQLWNQLSIPIIQSNFWDLPFNDNSFNKDGAIWILECQLGHKFNIIQRWDNGYLTSIELNKYLFAIIDFTNHILPLKSKR